MLIRRYKIQDTDALNSIYHDTIHNVNKQDYTPEELEAWAPSGPYTEENRNKDIERFERINPFVAVEGTQPIGFAELEEEGYINCFFVRQDSIGKGVGKALLGACIAEAKRLGYRRVFAGVSITARPFFLKQGFRVVRPTLDDVRGIKMKFYEMEKDINSPLTQLYEGASFFFIYSCALSAFVFSSIISASIISSMSPSRKASSL